MGNVAMPVTPPTLPPSVPPIQPPIGDPIDGPLLPPIDPPKPPQVPPPVTQPGGPGPIDDPGKQPPGDFYYQMPEPPPSIGGPGGDVGGGSLRPDEYDPLSDPRIFDLINQRIDQRVEALGVPQQGFSDMMPRSDQDIQSLIDQSLSGFQPQQPAFNENELVDRLRNQFVSYDRLPDVIPEPVVGGSAFDPSDIYGQLGELRGQFSSLPQGGGRTDAEIQALIDAQLQGFQPPSGTPPRSDQDIQGLIDQRLAGFEQPNFRDEFMSIDQRIDDLYNRPQFTPYDPSGLQDQFRGLQDQFANFQPYDPSGLQEQFGNLQNQFGQLEGQFQGMPNFDDFAMRSDLAPQYNDADLRQQLGQLEGQFQGFQQGLPDFNQFAMQSDIVPQNFDDRFMSIDQQLSNLRTQPGFDPTGLQQQISGLQDQFSGF